jgi:DNA-binding transcriptional MerR regulator
MQSLLPYLSFIAFLAGLIYHVGYTIKTVKMLKDGQDALITQQHEHRADLKEHKKEVEAKLKEVEDRHREKHDTLFSEINLIKQSLGKIETGFEFIKQALSDLKRQ